MPDLSFCAIAPSSRFSRTESVPKIACSWGT